MGLGKYYGKEKKVGLIGLLVKFRKQNNETGYKR